MVIESTFMSLLQIQELWPFNDFVKSRRPYWILLIEKGPSPASTFVYADGHRVQIYVSITNTEAVISMLML